MVKSGSMLPALALAGILLLAPQGWAQDATDLDCNGCVEKKDIAKEAVSKDRLKDKSVTKKKIKDEAVTKKKIKDEAVTEDKIKDEAVTEDKIADESVTEGKIAEEAVSEGKIAEEAVSEGKIQADAVNGAKVADGSLTGADIADGTITADDLGPGSVGIEELSADIAAGVTGVEFSDSNGEGNPDPGEGIAVVLDDPNWAVAVAVQVTAPAAGFVTCIGTGVAELGTPGQRIQEMQLGWSTNPGEAADFVKAIGVSPGADIPLRMPISVVRTFEVLATGTTTYNLLARCRQCSTLSKRYFHTGSACMYFAARL